MASIVRATRDGRAMEVFDTSPPPRPKSNKHKGTWDSIVEVLLPGRWIPIEDKKEAMSLYNSIYNRYGRGSAERYFSKEHAAWIVRRIK